MIRATNQVFNLPPKVVPNSCTAVANSYSTNLAKISRETVTEKRQFPRRKIFPVIFLWFLAGGQLTDDKNLCRAAQTSVNQEFRITISSENDLGKLLKEGVKQFRLGEVERSLTCFDRIIEVSPLSKPFLWQRGISLYYKEDFLAGAQQFRTDVRVNPNDTEELIWERLCKLRLAGPTNCRQISLEAQVCLCVFGYNRAVCKMHVFEI